MFINLDKKTETNIAHKTNPINGQWGTNRRFWSTRAGQGSILVDDWTLLIGLQANGLSYSATLLDNSTHSIFKEYERRSIR